MLNPTENCLEDEFRCGNGTCIDKSLRCNQVYDCLPEGNDEFGCGKWYWVVNTHNFSDTSLHCLLILTNCTTIHLQYIIECTANSFKCLDGSCIDNALYCDGVANCIDNSDENDCDGTN